MVARPVGVHLGFVGDDVPQPIVGAERRTARRRELRLSFAASLLVGGVPCLDIDGLDCLEALHREPGGDTSEGLGVVTPLAASFVVCGASLGPP